MSTIQDFFTDLLNGFAVDQIPLFLFQLFCAAIAAHILQLIVNKKLGEKLLEYSALIAVSAALMASLVKMTEPLAILGAAVLLLLLRGKEKGKLETIGTVMVVLIGVGCGVGSVVQTGIGCVVLFGIIFFTPLKK
jgi:hypothetical protein